MEEERAEQKTAQQIPGKMARKGGATISGITPAKPQSQPSTNGQSFFDISLQEMPRNLKAAGGF